MEKDVDHAMRIEITFTVGILELGFLALLEIEKRKNRDVSRWFFLLIDEVHSPSLYSC